MLAIENFEVKLSDFEKTLGIFKSMTMKPLEIFIKPITSKDKGSKTLSLNESFRIVIPTVILGKASHESYYAYVLFEHEIAHVVFKSDIKVLMRFIKNKQYKHIAHTVFNIVEDERVDILWNEIYTTPLRNVWNWFRGVVQPLSPIDILLDVRCNNKAFDDENYIKVWQKLQEMIKGVHKNIYVASTTRVSEQIYDYVVKLMKEEEENKKTKPQQRNELLELYSLKADGTPKDSSQESQTVIGNGKSQQDSSQGETTDEVSVLDNSLGFAEDVSLSRPAETTFPKISLGVKSKGITPEEEIKRTEKIIEKLKSRMAHTNLRETPESLMGELGGLSSDKFTRRETPLEIDKYSVSLDIKAIKTEWIDDEGEYLDIEETIYKRLTKDPMVSTMVDEVEGLGMHVLFLLDYSGSMDTVARRESDKKIRKVNILASIVWSIWNELTLIPGCKAEAIIYSGIVIGKKSLSCRRIDEPNELLFYDPQGGTKSDVALEYAYRIITTRSERGVIIHVTDGETYDKKKTGDVLRRIQDEGVPVFNIFIRRGKKQIEYIRGADRDSHIVVDLDDLADSVKRSIVPVLENYLKNIT